MKPIPFERLIEAVAAHYGVTVADIHGRNTHKHYPTARRAVWWIARRCGMTYRAIAPFTGHQHEAVRTGATNLDDALLHDPAHAARLHAIAAPFLAAGLCNADGMPVSGIGGMRKRKRRKDAIIDYPTDTDFEPLEVDEAPVRAYAEKYGLTFRSWDDLPAVNNHRFLRGKRELKRKFP